MSDAAPPSTPHFRAGFVSFLGKPNAGKSTLLNALTGAKLAAVSGLPQTTRERLSGIVSDDVRQIVFIDLPGLMEPTDRLNEVLRDNVIEGLSGVDAVLHLVDVEDKDPLAPEILRALGRVHLPLVLAVTKLDGHFASVDAHAWAEKHLPQEARERYRKIIGVSARTKKHLTELVEILTGFLPESAPLYDPETLTDRDMRYLSQEAIREKAFMYLHEELPYSVAVLVEEFQERDMGKWYIGATIYVEKDTQKGIVIGHNGEMLKKISQAARRDIEALCDAPVYLDLWVKVREKWRKNEADLKMFGYRPPAGKKKGKRRDS